MEKNILGFVLMPLLVWVNILLYRDLLRRNSEYNWKFDEFCKNLSYPVQKHIITTDDGYKLVTFRI